MPKEKRAKIDAWLDGRFWLYDNRIAEADGAESVLRVLSTSVSFYVPGAGITFAMAVGRTCRRILTMLQRPRLRMGNIG